MPIVIMLGHIVNLLWDYYQCQSFVWKLIHKGFDVSLVCCVALFFFISGYGIESNIKYKELPRLIITWRMRTVLIPFLIVNILYVIVHSIADIEFSMSIVCMIFIGNAVSWFVKVLLLMYLFYYIAILLERWLGLGRIYGLSILTLVYYITLLCINDDAGLFVQSVPGFALGVIAKCKLQSPLRKTDLLKMIVATIIIILISVIVDSDYVIGPIVALEISIYSGMVCMIIYYLSYYIHVQTIKKCVSFFADISYEIYLTHPIWLVFCSYIDKPIVYVAFVVFATIISSLFVKKLRVK